ncbi:MAG: hypothetical protein M9949_13035 [Candidatus Kapabacteria bacterium]|nr:hypothetical protein [Candidatus Kapabacteria bacterium]
MAEIKIEQKKQAWPWVIAGLVIAALLLYFLVFSDNDKNTEEVTESEYVTNTNEPELIEVKENNSTVAAYVNYVENSKTKMSLDHEFTNEALLKLIDATNAMADEVDYDVRADLEKVKGYANMITEDPFVTTHADNIRMATDILTNVLQNIQKAKYPSLADEVQGLRSASESIKPGILTLEQKDAVKNYFAKSSDLLQKMN